MQPIPDPSDDITTGYLLVDISNLPDMDCDVIKMVSCVPPDLTNAQELMPCLIAVGELSLTQRNQLVTMLNYQRAGEHAYAICAWLDCDLDIENLAVHIAGLLTGPGSGSAAVFWRYFDPRVFATAMALFSPTQRDALLGPIKSWRFVWCRHWWLVTKIATHSDPLTRVSAGWPTDQQWPRLLQSRVCNRILDKLGEEDALKPEDCLRCQKLALEYLAEDAITRHLNEDDQSEFGYLCAKYGASYRHHEKLNCAWDALQREEMSWTEVRFLLDQADYARLDSLRFPKKELHHARNLRVL